MDQQHQQVAVTPQLFQAQVQPTARCGRIVSSYSPFFTVTRPSSTDRRRPNCAPRAFYLFRNSSDSETSNPVSAKISDSGWEQISYTVIFAKTLIWPLVRSSHRRSNAGDQAGLRVQFRMGGAPDPRPASAASLIRLEGRSVSTAGPCQHRTGTPRPGADDRPPRRTQPAGRHCRSGS